MDNLCPSPLVCAANVCIEPGEDGGGHPPDGAVDARPDGFVVDAPDGPILLLHMDDDPSGGTAVDSAGGHNVTCTSCPTLISDARVGSGAYHFGGSDELAIKSSDFTRHGASTLAMWVRVDSTPTDFYATAAKNLPPDDASYGMSVGSDLRAAYYTSMATDQIGNTPLTMGAWHHLAMTWDGSSTVLGYLDGTLDDDYSTTGFGLTSAPFVIGDVNGGDDLVGDLDELVYYDRALSAAEVAALANP